MINENLTALLKSRLALTYFILYLPSGLSVAWFSLLFHKLGMDFWQIGVLSSIQPVTNLVIPPLWSFFSSISKQSRRKSLFFLVFFSALPVVFFTFSPSFLNLALICFFHFAPRSLLNPVLDSMCVDAISLDPGIEYGRIRLWGSIGFILTSTTGGFFFEGDTVFYFVIFYLLFCILGLIPVWMILDPPRTQVQGSEGSEGVTNIKNQFWFLFSAFLTNCSHSAYFVFFSIYLVEDIKISGSIAGLYWLFPVLCETLLMLFYKKMFPDFSSLLVLILSSLFAALRWAGMFFFQDPWILLALQGLHAFSFASFHLASIAVIPKLFARNTELGISLYISVSFGLSYIAGMNLSGILHEYTGTRLLFLASSAVSFFSVLSLMMVKTDRKA